MYAASYGGAVHFTGDCATGTRVSSYLVMLHVDAYIHGYTKTFHLLRPYRSYPGDVPRVYIY